MYKDTEKALVTGAENLFKSSLIDSLTAVYHVLFFHRLSLTALVYVILMTLPISQSYIQDAPAPYFSRSSNGECSNLLTSATFAGPLYSSRITIQALSSPALISVRGRGDKNGHAIPK